ncbi:uncharacterized protein LOC112684486 [Sipha flava]|uniref:Uncharacterized protein LOC112684486 n=1 Tax=Sipha flava TaxID=143950 RepID=A0A8B8FLM9_9HEMI|nr:uncharacterized protein LOC112684486 [Sipha flava]
MRLKKTKNGQSSLLSIFSTDPPNKKKRFEDKALEGFVLEHELELNVEHVSGSSSAQSTATTKHIAPIYEIQMPSCSSSSTGQFEIGLINKRDPAHGPKANKSGTIIEKVNQKYSEEIQENRLYLEALCESLIFCGRQSIDLSGHDESTDSKNRGNFLELMKLPTFQNELLSIIGEQIKCQIAKEVKGAKVFAIIADETQDIAKHEQVAIVLRNTFFVLQSLYNFIEKSTKRHAIFENIKKSFQSFSGGTSTLKYLSNTRWACRVESVRSLLDNFDTTLTTLREISDTDPDSGGQANALLKNLENLNFVFDLLLLKRVLAQCDILSKILQSSSVTYEIVKSVKNSTLEVLKSFRTDEFFSKLFNHSTEIADKCGFRAAQLPRQGKIPSKIGGGSKTQFESVEHYYKVSIVWPVIDILNEEIETRLQEKNRDVLNNLSKVLGGTDEDTASVKYECKYYNLDNEHLLSELRCFYKMEESRNKTIQERSDVFIQKSLKSVFPMLFELFRVFYDSNELGIL